MDGLEACNVLQVESAERAIAEGNDSLVSGVQFKVKKVAYNFRTLKTGDTGPETACRRSHSGGAVWPGGDGGDAEEVPCLGD